jgi:hypothetical protein
VHRHTTPTIEIQMLLNYLLPLPVAPAAVATTPASTTARTLPLGGRGGGPDQEAGQEARAPHVARGAPEERAAQAQGRVSGERFALLISSPPARIGSVL